MEEAARRARRELRRWCVKNGATRLATLTYKGEGEHDLEAVWRDIETLRRRLRELGFDGAFAAVPEAHPNGHGWHVHCAVAKFVPKDVLRAAWGGTRPLCGFVDIRKIRAAQGTGAAGARAHARRCASYLSEYVTKADRECYQEGDAAPVHDGGGAPLVPRRPFNGKRYSLTRGHRVEVVRWVSIGRSWALHDLEHVCGYPLVHVWSSPAEGWTGPPIELLEG